MSESTPMLGPAWLDVGRPPRPWAVFSVLGCPFCGAWAPLLTLLVCLCCFCWEFLGDLAPVPFPLSLASRTTKQRPCGSRTSPVPAVLPFRQAGLRPSSVLSTGIHGTALLTASLSGPGCGKKRENHILTITLVTTRPFISSPSLAECLEGI